MSGAGSPLSSHQRVEYDDSEPSQAYELFSFSSSVTYYRTNITWSG